LKQRTTFFIVAMTIAIAACAPPAPLAPVVVPEQQPNASVLRYLIDPRIGFRKATPPNVDKRFDAGWRLVQAGDFAGAHGRLDDLVAKDPSYLPARLALAAVLILSNRLDVARTSIDRILAADPNYTAARVYDAELLLLEQHPDRAYEAYRAIAAMPNAPPTAIERANELGRRRFDELFAAAQAAPPADSIALLNQVLAIDPSSRNARMLLVQRLESLRRFDEARAALEPLLSMNADADDVQQALAEIDAGSGRYQEAIVRYERLARRTHDARYDARPNELKQQFAAANMPLQFQRAFESERSRAPISRC